MGRKWSWLLCWTFLVTELLIELILIEYYRARFWKNYNNDVGLVSGVLCENEIVSSILSLHNNFQLKYNQRLGFYPEHQQPVFVFFSSKQNYNKILSGPGWGFVKIYMEGRIGSNGEENCSLFLKMSHLYVFFWAEYLTICILWSVTVTSNWNLPRPGLHL